MRSMRACMASASFFDLASGTSSTMHICFRILTALGVAWKSWMPNSLPSNSSFSGRAGIVTSISVYEIVLPILITPSSSTKSWSATPERGLLLRATVFHLQEMSPSAPLTRNTLTVHLFSVTTCLTWPFLFSKARLPGLSSSMIRTLALQSRYSYELLVFESKSSISNSRSSFHWLSSMISIIISVSDWPCLNSIFYLSSGMA